jgi:hypothetical protein
MTMPRADNVRRKLGDRRIRPRFDIVGDLWGTLEAVLPLPLRNVGRGGALIESHLPLPAESVHRLMFRSNGEDISTDVRVRYVRPLTSAEGQRKFLIGLEFMAVHPVLLEQIERWLIEGAAEGEMAGVEA